MWVQLAIYVVCLVASLLLAKKAPKQEPLAPGQIESATAEEGRNIPVLFGTRDIATQNVVWYGDIRVVPIKKSSGGKKG